VLAEHGASIFFANQDGMGIFETNALQILDTIEQILLFTGCDKINVIAHSKGGIDIRVLLSELHSAQLIASVTTISSPQQGSRTMDLVMRIPTPLLKTVALPVNAFYRLMGDKHPDFFTVCCQLTTSWMQRFNSEHPMPDCAESSQPDGTLCQSAAAAMSSPLSDPTMAFSNVVISCVDGPNDGLVEPNSSHFGNYLGTLQSSGRQGVSHIDVVDMRGKPRGGTIFINGSWQQTYHDITEFYLELARQLKQRGL
jgi:triacylglycerol lipase